MDDNAEMWFYPHIPFHFMQFGKNSLMSSFFLIENICEIGVASEAVFNWSCLLDSLVSVWFSMSLNQNRAYL